MNLTKMLACQFVINWVWCPHDNWTTTSALDFLSTARCWSSIHLYINSLYGLKVFDESVFFFCSSESKHSTSPEEGTISTRNATREYRHIGSSLTAGMCFNFQTNRAVMVSMRRRVSRREHWVLSQ